MTKHWTKAGVVWTLAMLGIGASGLFAQQEPLYSQYQLNAFVINPAVAGSQQHHEIRMNSRVQWSQFPGSPRTFTLSYHGRTDDKSGMGGLVFSDQTGPTRRNGLQVAYAFRVPLGEPGNFGQNTLSLGFAGKIIQYSFRGEEVRFQQMGDPAAAEAAQGLTLADAAVGLYWYNERFYAGFSAPNLIQADFGAYVPTQPDRALAGQLARHYFLQFGTFLRYDHMNVEPGVLVKKVPGAPYQIEATMKWHLMDDRFLVGLGYRTDWLVTSFFAIRGDAWILAYSSDLMIPSALRQSQTFGPSHEFTLGLDLGRQWNTIFRGE